MSKLSLKLYCKFCNSIGIKTLCDGYGRCIEEIELSLGEEVELVIDEAV